MIASVAGLVAAIGPDGVVIEVGGIGLAVSCAAPTLAALSVGRPARLSTSLVVREDSLTLYGFADDEERGLFELLQTANGVGPKLAQTILATLPPREIRKAVAGSDLATLVRVPGIGRRGAEKIVVELRDRIQATTGAQPATAELAGVTAIAPWQDQVVHALANLGFGAKEATEAIEAVVNEGGFAEDGTTPEGTAPDDAAPHAAALDGVAPDAAETAAQPEISIVLRRALQLLGRAR